MIKANDLSIESCRAYHLRCYDAFGYEFWSSSICAKLIYWMPVALDAITVVGQRRGQAFLDFFGEVMTGVRPKSEFAQPALLMEITAEIVRQFFIQYVLRYPSTVPSIGEDIVNTYAGKKKGKFV